MRNEVKELFEEIPCNASVSQTWCMCVCVEGGGGGGGEGRGALDSNVLRNEVKDLFEILGVWVCVLGGGGGGAGQQLPEERGQRPLQGDPCDASVVRLGVCVCVWGEGG